MKSRRLMAISGSLLSALMTTGCLGLRAFPGSDRWMSPWFRASEVAQVKENLDTFSRGQQVYYLEMGEFAESFAEMNTGLSQTEGNYQIEIVEVTPEKVIMIAKTEAPNALRLSAGVFITVHLGNKSSTAIVCESKTATPMPRLEGEEAVCDDAR